MPQIVLEVSTVVELVILLLAYVLTTAATVVKVIRHRHEMKSFPKALGASLIPVYNVFILYALWEQEREEEEKQKKAKS